LPNYIKKNKKRLNILLLLTADPSTPLVGASAAHSAAASEFYMVEMSTKLRENGKRKTAGFGSIKMT
jgi:hypothetical protein